MIKSTSFPTTIVDGFFDDPDIVRKLALEQKFYHDPRGTWPGKRCNIFDISPILGHNIVQKALLLFFNELPQYTVTSYFQLVEKKYGKGWVHRDVGNNNIVSGIIYLTPGSKSGTSLYTKKRPFEYNDYEVIGKKVEAYNNINNNIPVDTIDYSLMHNSEYDETVSISGVYNRLILFDSNLYHGAHDFFGDDSLDSRLTIVFFINNLSCNNTTLPIPRMSVKLEDNAI